MESAASLAESATVARIDDGLLSISCVARESGRDRRTISKLLDEAGVSPAGQRSGHPVYRLRDILAILVDGGGEVRPSDQLALARAEESRVDKALKELELGKREGRLTQADEARLEMADMAKQTIQLLDVLPDILERDCGIPPKAVVRAQEVINREREKLAEALQA